MGPSLGARNPAAVALSLRPPQPGAGLFSDQRACSSDRQCVHPALRPDPDLHPRNSNTAHSFGRHGVRAARAGPHHVGIPDPCKCALAAGSAGMGDLDPRLPSLAPHPGRATQPKLRVDAADAWTGSSVPTTCPATDGPRRTASKRSCPLRWADSWCIRYDRSRDDSVYRSPLRRTHNSRWDLEHFTAFASAVRTSASRYAGARPRDGVSGALLCRPDGSGKIAELRNREEGDAQGRTRTRLPKSISPAAIRALSRPATAMS